MTIKQLAYFITVYEKQSVTKASKELYISQQAISTSIIDLEKELGYTLFERNNNQIKPSVYGKYLYERSINIVNDFNNIKYDFDANFKKSSSLKIVTAPGVLRSIPIGSIIDFQENNKNIKTTIEHHIDNTCEEKIKNNEADLALSINSQDITGLDKTIISSEPYYIITSTNHRLKNKKKASFADLKNEKLVIFDENYRIYGNLQKICRDAGFEANIVFTSTEAATLAKYAIASCSIFVCVKHIIDELRLDNMLAIPIDTNFCWEIVALTKSENKHNKANDIKDKFIKFITKSISKDKIK